MAALEHHAGVVDADLGQVLGPRLERGAVRYSERQMVEARAG